MRIVGVLQARTSSSRLPGKVLADVAGAPMLARQVERIRRADGLGDLVLATSTEPSDDPLADLAKALGLPVFRGPLDNVLARYIGAARTHRADVVVRLTGDCPLTDPDVIDRVISEWITSGADYAANRATYPDGLDVEVVTADALEWLASQVTTPQEREHVTLGIYRRPARFRLAEVANPIDLSHLRWTVDTPEDLAWVRQVYAALYPAAFTMADVLDLIESGTIPARTGAQ